MTAVAFPLPVLPAQAFRRSWLVDQCRDAEIGQKFRKLLFALDPRTRETARGWTWAQVFAAVASEVGELFPIYEPDPGQLEWGEATLADYWQWGIPVAPLGNTEDMGGCALEFANVTLYPLYREEPGECPTLESRRLLPWIATWWAGPVADKHGQMQRQWRLPRGRKLAGPWVGLLDLVRWVRCSTGNIWLDTHPDEIDGGGGPAWTLSEIRSLARLWKQAEPIHARASALCDYINARPNDRLHLLYRVLRGEPEALAEVTETKRAQTLAEVFLGKERR